jgi:hypothetical protein
LEVTLVVVVVLAQRPSTLHIPVPQTLAAAAVVLLVVKILVLLARAPEVRVL